MRALVFALVVAACFAQQNVKVDLYMESYCPGCESYTQTEVAPALAAVGEIMDFMVWPYGNANEKQNADGTWAYTCQHGVNECIGNMWEACAIEYNNVTLNDAHHTPKWWSFFLCMEASNQAGVESVASACAQKGGLDWSQINTCAGPNPAVGTATDGNPLMHKIAVVTNNLQPPHQWTPWVVINGVPLTEDQLNLSLTKLVCQAYTGTPPSGCGKYLKSNAEQICKKDL
jgi:interferon gamma-inducible protein 30